MGVVVRERNDIDCVVQDRETGIACTVDREVGRGGQARAIALQCVERGVAMHARLLDTVKAATMFSLGRDGDNDKMPYVSVNRQYYLDDPGRAWVVSIVDGTPRFDDPWRKEFAVQAHALEYGWWLLGALRPALASRP